MLTKHFHLTQVWILTFSKIETGNRGVDTYSVGITIMIYVFGIFQHNLSRVVGCHNYQVNGKSSWLGYLSTFEVFFGSVFVTSY